jgi:hypothetical protein
MRGRKAAGGGNRLIKDKFGVPGSIWKHRFWSWSTGVLEYCKKDITSMANTPALQYSNTPRLI